MVERVVYGGECRGRQFIVLYEGVNNVGDTGVFMECVGQCEVVCDVEGVGTVWYAGRVWVLCGMQGVCGVEGVGMVWYAGSVWCGGYGYCVVCRECVVWRVWVLCGMQGVCSVEGV